MNSILFLGIFGCAFAAPDLFSVKGKLDGRIVGGDPVNIEDYPFQLALFYKSDGDAGSAGATVISELWALTAAHCVVDDMNPSNYMLISNSSIVNVNLQYGIRHPALEVYKHELFNDDTHDYDVAVIKVGIPFLSSNSVARTVVLPAPGISVNVGAKAFVSGYGRTLQVEDIYPDKQLRAVQVPIISRSDCENQYLEAQKPHQITERMICAAYKEGGKDSCRGDSGGPLIVDNKQVGIVSWGVGCAVPGQPGVYSNVGDKEIRTWITDRTGI